jgi:hypothetical protein
MAAPKVEIINKKRIKVEEGWNYSVGSDGFVYRTKKGIKEQIGSKKINKKDGYFYFVDKQGRISSIPLKGDFMTLAKEIAKVGMLDPFDAINLSSAYNSYNNKPPSEVEIKKQEESLRANSAPGTEEKIRDYLMPKEKVLCSFIYQGGKEFGNSKIVNLSGLKVLYVATDERIMKIRYGGGLFNKIPETIEDIAYSSLASVYLDKLYGVSYYQLTWQGYKEVEKIGKPNVKLTNDKTGETMRVNVSAHPPRKERQFFEVKPIKWRILDITNPEVKKFVNIIKEQIKKNKKTNTFKVIG